MASHERDARLAGDRKARLADRALDAACVDDDGVWAHERRVATQPVDACLGVAREHDELARGHELVGERPRRCLDGCEGLDVLVEVKGIDLVAASRHGAGYGAADEAKAHDAHAARDYL